MPATSEKQRRFFGAELGRERAGKATETGMSEGKLRDFAKSIKPKPKAAAASKPKPTQKPPKKPHEDLEMAIKAPNALGRY